MLRNMSKNPIIRSILRAAGRPVNESSRYSSDKDAAIGKLFPEERWGGADWSVRAWKVKGTGPRDPGHHDGHFITDDEDGNYSLVRRQQHPDDADGEERWEVHTTGSRKKVVDAALDLAGRGHEKTSGPAEIKLHGYDAADFMHGHREAAQDGLVKSNPDYHSKSTSDAISSAMPYHIDHDRWEAEHLGSQDSPHDLHPAGTIRIKVHPVSDMNEGTDSPEYAAYAHARAQYSKALDAPERLLGRAKKDEMVSRRKDELTKARAAVEAKRASK